MQTFTFHEFEIISVSILVFLIIGILSLFKRWNRTTLIIGCLYLGVAFYIYRRIPIESIIPLILGCLFICVGILSLVLKGKKSN